LEARASRSIVRSSYASTRISPLSRIWVLACAAMCVPALPPLTLSRHFQESYAGEWRTYKEIHLGADFVARVSEGFTNANEPQLHTCRGPECESPNPKAPRETGRDPDARVTAVDYLTPRDNSARRDEVSGEGSGLRPADVSRRWSRRRQTRNSVTEMRPIVTCTDIDNLIISGPADLLQSPGVAAHMAACKYCSGLLRLLQQMEETPSPEESQVKRIEATISACLRPVRPLAPMRFFLGACAFIFLVLWRSA
jgi:hypothetical protein